MDWNHSNSSRFLIVQDFPSVLLLFLRQQRPFSGLCLWVHTYSFCWMSRGRITVLKLRYIFNDFSYVLAIIFQWHWAISASVHEAAFSTLLALTWFPSDMKVVCSVPHTYWPLIFFLGEIFCVWDVDWFAVILYIYRIWALCFTSIRQIIFSLIWLVYGGFAIKEYLILKDFKLENFKIYFLFVVMLWRSSDPRWCDYLLILF